MSAQAPSWYIKRLSYGFLLCMLAIIGGLAGPVLVGLTTNSNTTLFPVALSLLVLISFSWTAGVWLITRPRTGMGTISRDQILDNTTLVKVIRIMSFAWPCWTALAIIKVLGASGVAGGAVVAAANPVFLDFMIALAGIVAWAGLIPACVYFAELSYWASDDHLVGKLRATAWVMMFAGIATVLSKLLIMTSLPIASPAKIVHIWATIFSVGATAYLFYSMFRMSLLLNWVLSHQRISADKYNRINERITNHLNHNSKISAPTKCDDCGYELKGLPFAGKCPECGEAYGEPSSLPFPIRDPARDIPKQSQAPINVADSTHGNIKHSRTLGTPLEEFPPQTLDFPNTSQSPDNDQGDIPLADEA